jgi:hypothetical protein
MTQTYKAGQRLEAKYNGSIVTIQRIDPDGGIRVADTQGRTSITSTRQLERLYRPMRGDK